MKYKQLLRILKTRKNFKKTLAKNLTAKWEGNGKTRNGAIHVCYKGKEILRYYSDDSIQVWFRPTEWFNPERSIPVILNRMNQFLPGSLNVSRCMNGDFISLDGATIHNLNEGSFLPIL